MKTKLLSLTLVTLATVAPLAACSANWHTVFRHKSLKAEEKAVITVDAKQRAILTSDTSFCSEPSPDVFSVIAQALSAGGSFSKTADPASLEAALNFAFSSAEQGSTIPRTQTMNMLRELMFRTCERYLNGGITSDELPIQAVRDQRLMVSILAIEQLTGAVMPKPVAISATSSAALDSREALIRLDDAQKELVAAKAATAKAQKDFDNEDGEGHACKAIADALKEGKELTAEQSPKREPCEKAASALVAAKEREVRATEHHADLRRLSTGIGSASTEADGSTAGGIDQGREISGVVDAVQAIVEKNFTDGTEVMLFCLRNLAPRSDSDSPATAKLRDEQRTALQDKCFDFLSILIESRSSVLLKEKQIAIAQSEAVSSDRFATLWPALQQRLRDDAQRAALITAVRGQLRPSQRALADCLDDSTHEAIIKPCFMRLPKDIQRKIADKEL